MNINEVELASMLAEERVKQSYICASQRTFNITPSEEELFKLMYIEDEDNDEIRFKDQELINEYYDMFYDMIVQTKIKE